MTGYALLVNAAWLTRDPRIVTEAVARLGPLRDEEHLVRTGELRALKKAAPLLTAEAATTLDELTSAIVAARYASTEATALVGELAVAVLRHHLAVPQLREWALRIVAVSGDASVPVLPRFDRLRRGEEREVFDRLRGWVEAAVARGRYGPLFALTRALGRRAWRLPELQDLLRQAVGPHTPASVARTAWWPWSRAVVTTTAGRPRGGISCTGCAGMRTPTCATGRTPST